MVREANTNENKLVYDEIYDICKNSSKYNLVARYRLFKYIDKYGINYQYYNECQTIFMILMILRRMDLLKLIISKKYDDIDMNVADWCGRTALFFIIDMYVYNQKNNSSDCIDIINYVIKCGGNINHRDKYNRTPLATLVDLNYRYGKWPAKSIDEFMKYDNWKIDKIKLLLDSGADVNVYDNHGYTPLMVACDTKHPHVNIVKILLEYGANIYNKVYRHGKEYSAITILRFTGDIQEQETRQVLLDKHTELTKIKIQLIGSILPLPIAECIIEQMI